MAKVIKCPNCGASDPEKVEGNQYQCNFCESHFVLEDKNRQTDIHNAINQIYSRSTSEIYPTAGTKTRIALVMGVAIMLLTGALIAFITFNNVSESIGPAVGEISEDDYWGAGSVHQFYVFEGNKGPVIWMLLNQSSKGLDSSKYTLRVYDPLKKKLIYDETYITMTWKESFNFRNYLSEMVSYNNEVYLLSEQNGIEVRDLYSGKVKFSNERFGNEYSELKSGIISSKNVGYREALEFQTNDGFKKYFLPKYDLMISQEKFDDYRAVRGKVRGFVFEGDPRQKLYLLEAEQDTLRKDLSFSSHYLKEYKKNAERGKKIDVAFGVDTAAVFFNVKTFFADKEQIVFAFTEGLDKKSKAMICKYSVADLSKPLWKLDLNDVSGFEKIIEEDIYVRSNATEKELALWYQNAKKKAVGINLKNGKINWEYEQ